MRSLIFAALLLSVLPSCKKFIYHPNEVRPEERNLNARNIEQIQQLPKKSNYKFILIGDTQRFYSQLDAFVGHINTRDDISFIVLNGDLVDFGLNREYNWIAEQLGKLNIPYVSAIGNHDMIANGRAVFKQMFGPENFSFTYSDSKFIFVNTNSREVGFDGTIPDLNWLQSELQAEDDAVSNIFVISHVAPFSADFDKNLEEPFANLLASSPTVRLSLHGHEHRYQVSQPYGDGLTYVLAGAMDKPAYVVVSVTGTDYSFEEITY